MSPRARRILAWTAGSIVAVGVLVAFSGWWVTNTERGAKWGFERLGLILPGKLNVRGMSGPLRGPLEVRQLTYRTDHMEITADRVRLRWKLSDLIHKRLDIQELYAEDVRVLVGASGDTPKERDSLQSPLPDIDLPVSIVVHEAVLNRMQIKAPGPGLGLMIDRVRLDASTFRDSLNVNSLSVRSRTLDLDLKGKALPQGAYPVALTGTWTWHRPNLPDIFGEGVLEGTVDTLHVRQRLSGPFPASVTGTLYRALRERMFDGEMQFTGLAPQQVRPDWPPGVYTGRAHVHGSLDAFSVEGGVRTDLAAFGPTDAAFRVEHEGITWRIERLAMRFPHKDARMQFQGTVTTGQERPPRFRLDTQWTNLDWPMRGTPWVRSDRGRGLLVGTAGDMEVRITADLGGHGLPPGRWYLDGRGGNGRLAVRTVIADLLNGRLTGSGRVAWSPRVEWRLGFQGEDIDPGSVWGAWPGSLAFDGQTHGMILKSGPFASVTLNQVDGTLRSQPVDGHGTLDMRGGQYTLNDAAVQWGPNHAQASGGFGAAWSLAWALEAPRLDAALPQSSGSLHAQGRVEGPRGRMRVTATAEGESLFYARTHVGTLRTQADVNLAPGGNIVLDAAATALDFGDRSIDRVVLTGRGSRDHHEVRASLAGRGDSLVAVFDGGLQRGGQWRGMVRTLDLVKTKTGNWSLESPAALAATAASVELRNFAWRSGAARLGMDADWRRAGPWSVDARIDSVSLASFQPLLPDRLRLEGGLQGVVRAHTVADGRLFAHVDVLPGPGTVSYLSMSGEWVPTRFQGARLHAEADGGGLTGEVVADLVDTGTLRGTLRLPGLSAGTRAPSSQVLDGRLALHLTDLRLAQGLSPELEATGGALDAELVLGGTLGTPSLQGDAQLRGGHADVPRLGIHVQDATLVARSSPGGKLAVDGSFRSGPGVLTFTGTADLAERAKLVAQLRASGTNLQGMNTREVQFLVSPDVRVVLAGDQLNIQGVVVIPQGDFITHWDADDVIVRPSPDVVYRGPDAVDRGPIQVHTRVRLVVGDQVRVRGFGLDVRPTGSVLAIDEPGLPVLGTGELKIENGIYRIYGQDLAIEHGRLIFGGGPIINPGLDARAQRTASDGVVAGFIVRGTVQQPDVRVFSEPPLGESQALAYILLGRPLEAANLPEGQLVSTMATSLGVRGTNFIAHGLASNLGIDEARIETSGGIQHSSLILGSQLSSKLYLGYGIGLFDPTTVLRLRYLLSKHWTIEAETARQNRVDLLYTIER